MAEGVHNVSYRTPVLLTRSEAARGWRVVGRLQDLPLAGVYAIYRGGALVYIGSSNQLSVRLQPYFKITDKGRPLVVVKIAPSVRMGDWLMREYRLIRRLRPVENRMHVTGRPARRHNTVRAHDVSDTLDLVAAAADQSERMVSEFARDISAFYLRRRLEGAV